MKIVASCKLNETGVWVNGTQRTPITEPSGSWKKDLYKSLDIDYPKFYKMDALAKMAFLGTELISTSYDFSTLNDHEVALLFSNASSSYDTDQKFVESYEEKGSPGPSLFVYTLPNILTGELAIRHKWYGENIFFIQENFDPEFYTEQINFYFRKDSALCLCGWVDSANGKEECLLFLVSPESEETINEELTNIYNQ